MVKNLPANTGESDLGSIPGSRRPPGGGNGNPLSSVLAGRIPWTEEPGKGSEKTERLSAHTSSLHPAFS